METLLPPLLKARPGKPCFAKLEGLRYLLSQPVTKGMANGLGNKGVSFRRAEDLAPPAGIRST